MSSPATNFKVGAFVLVAAGLGLGGTILLGSATVFQKTEIVETYSSESVNGLNVGSPVKFRGVTIGQVSEITFVTLAYGHGPEKGSEVLNSMVLVRMKIVQELIGVRDDEDFETDVQASVAQGLRARLVSEGITGGLYMQFEYTKDLPKESMQVAWTPAYPYVPGVPSRLNEILDGVATIVKGVQGVDFTNLGKDIHALVQHLDSIVEVQGKPALVDLKAFIEEARTTNSQVQTILADPNIQKSLANIASASDSLAVVLGEGKMDLKTTIAKLPVIAASLASGSAELDDLLNSPKLQAMLADLQSAAALAPPALDEARELFARVDRLIASEEYDIRVLMESLREMAENLDALSERLRQDAPQVLFGAPPPRVAPGAPLSR
ncbi:MAG: MCE family protein [Phycisphaerales bacterium]|nr:MCE family protein [Phycisphaerales bacterium]